MSGSDLGVKALLPFVPSGSDYEASRRLFADLGFEEVWENNGYAGFRNGAAQFILQKFDDEHFAGNFMVRINVENLDAWWQAVSQLDLPTKYSGFRINPPASFPWGREVNFIDLAGVCWHVGE
jgi:catechol 2,3-dioxygenase-like lactoylglutathione lyase family enzyme